MSKIKLSDLLAILQDPEAVAGLTMTAIKLYKLAAATLSTDDQDVAQDMLVEAQRASDSAHSTLQAAIEAAKAREADDETGTDPE